MAKPRKHREPEDYLNWVRTGGAIGDESMQEQDEFNDAGAGVEEGIKYVGQFPNEGVELKQQKGAEDAKS